MIAINILLMIKKSLLMTMPICKLPMVQYQPPAVVAVVEVCLLCHPQEAVEAEAAAEAAAVVAVNHNHKKEAEAHHQVHYHSQAQVEKESRD